MWKVIALYSGAENAKCGPNNDFLTLVIVFAVAGLLLLAVVAFVKVSVSEGYLYSVLFYSHIVTQYTIHFTQSSTAVFLPTALLNLNIGGTDLLLQWYGFTCAFRPAVCLSTLHLPSDGCHSTACSIL